MKRFFSGVQATGKVHLGNYLGAIKPWTELQGTAETIYFVPDLHTLNIRPAAADLRRDTLSTFAWMLAAGINPDQSTLFVQSQVPAHAQLAIILENYTTVGELNRMTQYKDKSAKRGPEGQLSGLLTYPVLMAADILLYDATHVPVGEDQKQHVELAREIATRFNNLHGPTFVVPECVMGPTAARVRNLLNPSSKMSKSDADNAGNLMLLDSPDIIRTKILRAVTDSNATVGEGSSSEGVRNLLEVFSALSAIPVADLISKYGEAGYSQFKNDLADVVISTISPLRDRYESLMADPNQLLDQMAKGRKRAIDLTEPKLAEVKQTIGLLP